MKLTEIFAAGTAFTEYDAQTLAATKAYVVEQPGKEVSLEGGAYKLKLIDHEFFVLFKQEALVGWARLLPINIKGEKLAELKLIYLLAEHRKSKAFLIMLNAIKHELKCPILVDGAVFTAGAEALAALAKRNQFKLQLINKVTGAKTPYTEVPMDNELGVLVEGFEFPLGEAYTAPGGATVEQSFKFFI